MPENKNIEWKESWRDEYQKWVCGFANAEGGKLIIGMSDKGKIVGVEKASKLLEDLPNKIKSVCGVLVDVELVEKDGKEIIEINIDPYPYPVSYKGKYFIRTGSTLQELKGNDLTKFLLERVGKKWDGVPVPKVNISDLSQQALKRYRQKAVKSGRIPEEVLADTDEMLIQNLRLIENGLLKRAAILLFHPDPEKFFVNAYVKIGFFKSDDDLIFQDEVHGNLMDQIYKSFDLLRTKYSSKMIEYSGISRIEKSLFPESALREALLNALAHKDYGESIPIQISVYPNHIEFWNSGELPEKLSIEQLKEKHPSMPYNPDLANGLFRCGDIESWGRGTIKIIKACLNHRLLPPIFNVSSGFQVSLISNAKEYLKDRNIDNSLIDVLTETLNVGKVTNKRVQEICEVSKATATRYLEELEGEFLERVGATGRGTYYIIKGS